MCIDSVCAREHARCQEALADSLELARVGVGVRDVGEEVRERRAVSEEDRAERDGVADENHGVCVVGREERMKSYPCSFWSSSLQKSRDGGADAHRVEPT